MGTSSRRRAGLALLVCIAACSSTPPAAPDLGADTRVVRDVAPQGDLPALDVSSQRDATPDRVSPDTRDPKAKAGLPFAFTRPAVGTPLTAAELTAITDKYIALLQGTRFFDAVDERVHGWPQSDPKKRYWYGTWWSGVNILKQGGKVTYQHGTSGADNNGLRTGPLLESICFSYLLWQDAKLEQLTRKLMRGLTSWILAMERMPQDPYGTLLSRAAYPEPISSTDGGRTFFIDTSASRPGVDADPSEYVHVPQNPHWGDIYIKNKRSKDDIGHMLRAIGTLFNCSGLFQTADAEQDYQEMVGHYVKWAQRVETDGWTIATLDKSGKLWLPPDLLAHFIELGNAECNSILSLRLFGRADPGKYSCGNGIHPLEPIVLQNDHNGEIVRSFHESAAKHALLASFPTVAKDLLDGLVLRMNEGMLFAETGNWPVHMGEEDLADLLVHAANLGVPLTSREVRWLHQQIEKAHTSYVVSGSPAVYKIFDPSTPDGAYAFNPPGTGLRFRSLALLVGTCVSQHRNPTSAALLDCARLKGAALP
jgi:hypothetical protein